MVAKAPGQGASCLAGVVIPDTVRTQLNCSVAVTLEGLDPSTVTWRDLNTSRGAFLDYLDCSEGCDEVVITTDESAERLIHFEVCGIVSGADCPLNYQICDTVVVEVVPTPRTTARVDICDGFAHEWQGRLFTEAGVYTDTLISSRGCDSLVTLDLKVNPSRKGALSVTICPGEVFELGGERFKNAGTYQVTLTDSIKCDSIVSLSLEVLPGPTPRVKGPPILCHGSSATLEVPNADQFSGFRWSNGATGPSITVRDPGTYTVTVTSPNSCSAPVSYNLKKAPPLDPTITGNQAIDCENQLATLRAAAYVDGVPDGIQLTWRNVDDRVISEAPVLETEQAGWYYLHLVDRSGYCSAVDSIEVTEATGLPRFTLKRSGVLDCRTSQVMISLELENELPNLFTRWTGPDIISGKRELFVSQPGWYFMEVTNTDNNCTVVDSIRVRRTGRTLDIELGNRASLRCEPAEVTLRARVKNGTPTYGWRTIEGNIIGRTDTQAVRVNRIGWYFVDVVNEATGCVGTDSILVVRPNPIKTVDLEITALCPGEAGGRIEVVGVQGGKTPFRYTLGDTLEATRRVFADVPAGPHQLQAIDGFGCRWDTTIQIQSAPVDTSLEVAAFCAGTEYRWNGRTYTEPGRYADTLTAVTGCDSVARLELRFDSDCESVSRQAAFCPGEAYELNGQTFTEPGTYNVFIEGTSGVDSLVTLELRYFPVDTPVIEAPPVLCAGDSVELRVSSSFAAYRWSDGSAEPTLWVNQPGNYAVTVTDGNGCTTQADYRVRESAIPVASITGDTLITCAEPYVVLQADSSLAGFSLTWLNPRGDELGGELTQWATEPGEHVLRASDTTGTCTTTDTFLVQISEEVPQLTFSTPELLTCQNGTVQLALSVEIQDFSVEWSGPGIVSGGNTPTPTVDRVGLYRAVVTSNAGSCVVSGAVEVREDRPRPTVTVDKEVRLDCLTGEARLAATSADPTVTYAWATDTGRIVGPADQAEIVAADVGWYELTTTDVESGCSTLDRIYVDHPEGPSEVKIRTIPSCANQENGYIIVDTIINGDPRFQYLINGMPPPDEQGSYVDLAPGSYQVDLIDSRGCVFPNIVVVDSLPVPETIQQVEICEGASYEWKGVVYTEPGRYVDTLQAANGCDSLDVLELQLLLAPRREIAVTICEGETYQFADTTLAEAGIYSFSAPAPAGCDSLLVVELNVAIPDSLTIQGPAELCAGTTAILQATGNFSTYQWNDGSADSTLQISAGGRYQLVATTSEGCQQTAELEVLEREAPTAIIQGPTAFDCRDSVVVLQGEGLDADQGWEAAWRDSTGQVVRTTSSLEIGAPGSYFLQVTDPLSGCSAMDSIQVEAARGGPEISFSGPFALTCRQEEVVLEVTVAGAPTLLDVQWSGPGIVDERSNLSVQVNAPGVYQIDVVNPADGCRSTERITVADDRLAPSVELAADTTALDCLTGTTTLSAGAAGEADWEYRWTTVGGQLDGEATQPTVPVSGAGLYQVAVVDAGNGCVSVDSILVLDNAGPAQVELVVEPACADTASGLLIVEAVSGGTGPYLYGLDSAALGSSNAWRELPGGAYRLQVEDAEGCTLDTVVTVEVRPAIEIALPAELDLRAGDSLALTPELNLPPEELAQINWSPATGLSCDNCLQPVAAPETFTTYRLQVADAYGCRGEATVRIFVDTSTPVYIPSAFSPNGDGVNDVFTVYSYDSVRRVKEFLIFDRWGGTVYQRQDFIPNDPNAGWDGRIDGRIASNGVFVYYAVVELYNGKEMMLKGDVTLMR